MTDPIDREAPTPGAEFWHSECQCHLTGLSYDFAQHVGLLLMAEGECCDMTGCVRLFEAIDPNCARIETVSGKEIDTAYVRNERGWRALWWSAEHQSYGEMQPKSYLPPCSALSTGDHQ
jgi:hypothetical protein